MEFKLGDLNRLFSSLIVIIVIWIRCLDFPIGGKKLRDKATFLLILFIFAFRALDLDEIKNGWTLNIGWLSLLSIISIESWK